VEPRGWVALVDECGQPEGMNHMTEPMLQGKTHDIPKRLVWDAWQKVKENKGAAGVDGVTIERFEADLRGNLYKLWNRMSSGSYFPGPVRAVEIPKKGGTRILGIPNIVDRIAQTVVVLSLEPELEKVFHHDSFGYRPSTAAALRAVSCKDAVDRRVVVTGSADSEAAALGSLLCAKSTPENGRCVDDRGPASR
jgi:hypothetical protein